MSAAPCRIYSCNVMHQRFLPLRYRFRYRVFSLLLDVERAAAAAKSARLFSYNRFNVFSFFDEDHGPRDGSPLRPWVDEHLADRGIDLEGGVVRLLCFPRVLGFAFNPLSLWFCYHRDGRLRAVLCEVRNTFGEKHGYLLHEHGEPLPNPLRTSREKRFHVSPFIGMGATYRFRIFAPDERLRVSIHEYCDQQLTLLAAQSGRSVPFTDPMLARMFLGVPLMTLKVFAMIHWQAFKIWRKGAPFYTKPIPPNEEVT